MNKTIFWIFAVLFCAFSVFSQENAGSENLIDTEMYSAVLAETRRMIVHLPANYSKELSKNYPVMYVLDGTSQDQHTFDKVSIMADAGLIPECIVVGIPNTRGNRNRDFIPPFMRTDVNNAESPFGKADNFLAFLEKELMPKIKATYRTSGYNALAGHSAGALFVLYTLLERPELFDARFAYSAPAWRFDDLILKRMEGSLRASKLRKKTFLFFSAGQQENENIVAAHNKLGAILQKRKDKNLKWSSYFTPLADHRQNPRVSTSKALLVWSDHLKKNK